MFLILLIKKKNVWINKIENFFIIYDFFIDYYNQRFGQLILSKVGI